MRVEPSKILVVEDEPDFVRLLEYTFERGGYKVFSASDAELGLKLARKHKPHLFILDVMLPGMDGLELCRLLRQESRSPIIFLTAKKNELDRQRSASLGADAYITKPTSVKTLFTQVKNLLERETPRL